MFLANSDYSATYFICLEPANAHTTKDLATLHGSLEAMLDGLADGSFSLNSVNHYNKFTDEASF